MRDELENGNGTGEVRYLDVGKNDHLTSAEARKITTKD